MDRYSFGVERFHLLLHAGLSRRFLAITRHRAAAGQHPTWAEALAGVDPDLLTPLTAVPDGWPLPPAARRRDLRTRMMTGLKQAG